MVRRLTALGIFCALHVDASEPDRFSVRRTDAVVIDRSSDARFAVHAMAELRLAPSNPPRFTLKSTAATCAPLPDALFRDGFE
jgi:hypothetical protein